MAITDWLAQPRQTLKGKKTYIVAAAVCILGFLEAFNFWTVPEYVWPLLAAVGLGTLRSGVNGVKDSLKDIKVWLLMLLLSGCVYANGLTFWGLAEKDLSSEQNAFAARIGYRHDYAELFVGSTWRPNYDAKTGEVSPPQIFNIGGLIHARDLLDPNNPLPWVPDLLLTMIPETMVAQPYFGVMGTINIFDQDAGHTGFPVGLLCKRKESDRSAYVVELNLFNQYFGQSSAVPDDAWTLYVGFCFAFGK